MKTGYSTKSFSQVYQSLKNTGRYFEVDHTYRYTENLCEIATPFIRIFKNGYVFSILYFPEQ